jgi:tetratricopeptide (TPR) repeat protein
MTEQSPLFAVKPIITYPREAQVGKTYLMTIDLQPEEEFEWQYDEEEYPIYCTVNSDLFNSKPVGEPVVVLHRFGGSYGEAKFLLTAALESGQGNIKVVLINAWGVSIKVLELEQVRLISRELIHLESDLAIEREATITDPTVKTLEEAVNWVPAIGEEKQKTLKAGCAVILTTLPVEYLAVRAYLTKLREEVHPQGTIYERGEFAIDERVWNVGIIEVGASNLNATLEVERAIAYFSPDILLSVGIAGGIKDVALGDVVVSTKIYRYESGKAEQTFQSEPEIELSDFRLKQLARAEARKTDWLERLGFVNRTEQETSDSLTTSDLTQDSEQTQSPPRIPDPNPRVFVAPIVAGEKITASIESEVFQLLRQHYQDALAVEMEELDFFAAGILSQIPALIVRGISDLIYSKTKDLEKSQEIAARHASAFAFEILAKLEIEDKDTKPNSTNFYAYDDAWVGRENLIRELSDRIRGNCRLLILVGITGIGKTALGERVAVEVADWFENDWSHYHQENFDDEQQTSDFASVAARWLEKWGQIITPDARKDPQQLLHRLIQHLQERRYLIQIDSLQNILQGNEEEGWSDFKDECWLKFFESYLKAETCESRLILTSQDLPGQIEEVGRRSQNFWYCQPLGGLEKPEQIALFEKTELDVSPDSESRTYLERISAAYEGHPLALRVIAGEIKNKPFEGNVLAYWNKYGSELELVEKTIVEAQEGQAVEAGDKFRLDRFTKTLRRNVRFRLNRSIERLRQDNQWAYTLLCETSVYRCPVPEDFWLSHLQDWDRNEGEQIAALDVLRDRYLIEELISNDQHLLRQHNLVRSITLERLQFFGEENILDEKKFRLAEQLNSSFVDLNLKEVEPNQLNSARSFTHYRAVANWLTHYQPEAASSRIGQVIGYLESFGHLCELEDWENAYRILSLQVDASINQKLLEQLGVWGYYGEQISLCMKLLGKLNQESDFRLRSCLGNAAYIHGDYNRAIQYFQQSLQDANQIDERNAEGVAFNNLGTVYNVLGNYSEATRYYRQALAISRESQNLLNVGKALSNLGIIYSNLGEYSQAIDCYQQALSITLETGNRLEEGYTLGNLGLVYNFLGNYEQAVAYCQQALAISREIGDRYGEENILGNLGIAYASLANYSQAVEYHQYQLTIAREIGDRRGEAIALSRLGSCLINLHQYSEALSYLEAALQIFGEIGDRANQANALKVLAELYQGLGQMDTACSFIEQALSIATELGIPLVQEIQNLRASIRED